MFNSKQLFGAIALLLFAAKTVFANDNMDVIQRLYEVGNHEALIKRVERTHWDSLSTPDLLITYLSAETNEVKVTRSLADHPRAQQFAAGYKALNADHISEALRHFGKMVNEEKFRLWGAIGQAEVGLVTDNISILSPAMKQIDAFADINPPPELRQLIAELHAQHLTKMGNPSQAMIYVSANRKHVGALFFCIFALGYYIDRKATATIVDHQKKCKRFEAWPSYELEKNRAIYELQGEQAALNHLDLIGNRWPKATEVSRAKLEFEIATGRGDSAKVFQEYRELATAKPISLPLLLRFAILSVDNNRLTPEILHLVDANVADRHRFASFRLLVGKLRAFAKKYEEALLELKKAHELAPNNLDILYEGLKVSISLRNEVEEMKWLGRILEIRAYDQPELTRFLELAKKTNECKTATSKFDRLNANDVLKWREVQKRLSPAAKNCISQSK